MALTIQDALNFVKGSVAKRAIVESVASLTHYSIRGGALYGANGVLSVCHPIPLELTANPQAGKFMAAINNCNQEVTMYVTKTGRLSVRSGSFRAIIDCTDKDIITVQPEGTALTLNFELLSILRKLEPFIGEDASRPWSAGVLLRGQGAYVTNNIVLVEHWIPVDTGLNVIIPAMAVKELIRLNREPEYLLVSDNHISFIFGDNVWLRTQLLSADYPDLTNILDKQPATPPQEIQDELWGSLGVLRPFLGELPAVYFTDEGITTTPEDSEGATVEIPSLSAKGAYLHKYLTSLEGVASRIHWEMYPEPALFFGENLRGAIVGVRL